MVLSPQPLLFVQMATIVRLERLMFHRDLLSQAILFQLEQLLAKELLALVVTVHQQAPL